LRFDHSKSKHRRGAAGVDPPALRAARPRVRHRLADHAALGHCWEVVSGGPDPGGELFAEREGAALERLERYGAVAEILVADRIEVVLADIHRQLGGPVIWYTLQADGPARIDRADPVRTGAEGRVQGRGLEIAAGVVGG
jgi:hypothetical protein